MVICVEMFRSRVRGWIAGQWRLYIVVEDGDQPDLKFELIWKFDVAEELLKP